MAKCLEAELIRMNMNIVNNPIRLGKLCTQNHCASRFHTASTLKASSKDEGFHPSLIGTFKLFREYLNEMVAQFDTHRLTHGLMRHRVKVALNLNVTVWMDFALLPARQLKRLAGNGSEKRLLNAETLKAALAVIFHHRVIETA